MFKKGTTIFLFPFKVYFKFAELEGTSAVPKVLISVPKKHFKSAVNRNRLKRLFRESYRIHKHKIQQTTNNKALQIAFLYVHSSALTYEEIEKKLILVINKINQHLPKNE
ncbi:MAG: ribonuclease P protein component [Cytophagales bacterium]